MIEEFTTKDMLNLLHDSLSQIKDNNENKTETILQPPNQESIFPCRVINTPIDTVLKSENAIPVLKNFQITIEHWCNDQKQCMEMANKTDKVLQEKNMIRTNTQAITYDEITKMYRFITIYEVRLETLTNTLKFIR